MQMCISTKWGPDMFLMGFVLKFDHFEVHPTQLVSIMGRMKYTIIGELKIYIDYIADEYLI